MKFSNLSPDKKIGRFSWNHQSLLGSGAFGQVFFGIEDQTQRQVAIKQMNMKNIQDPYLQQATENEIKIMRSINNTNIVNLIDVFQTTNNLYIILEFCNGGDLRSFLTKQGKIQESQAISILVDILNGCKALAQINVIHRDLKPENILIHDNVYKIADFGLSRQFEKSKLLETSCGTPLYMSPQILKNEKYTFKADIWAIGLIFYEILLGNLPWPASTQYELVNNVCNNPLKFPNIPKISSQSKELIRGCLQVNENKRYDWDQLFSNNLLKNIKKQSYIDKEYEDDPEFDQYYMDVIKAIQKEMNKKKISPDQLFDKYDKNKKGILQLEEFTNLIKHVYWGSSSQDCKDIFEEIDQNQDGYLSFNEFYEFIYETDYDTPQKNQMLDKARADKIMQKLKDKIYVKNLTIEQIFSFISNSNEIDKQTFYDKILKNIDPNISQTEINYIFGKFDINKDGFISVEEFKNLIPTQRKSFHQEQSPIKNYDNMQFGNNSPNQKLKFQLPSNQQYSGQFQSFSHQSLIGQRIIQDLKIVILTRRIPVNLLFFQFDLNKTNDLGFTEFRSLVDNFCPGYSIQDIQEAFKYLDIKKSNKIDLQEFQRILM